MRHQRTKTCGECRLNHVGELVVLNGWVQAVRDHGGLLFLDLRDRYGFTQVVADPAQHSVLSEVGPECVIAVVGKVRARPAEARNTNRSTGDIEIEAIEIELLNTTKVPPFEVDDECRTREELRLEHRYVDMRRRPVLAAMELRSRLNYLMRQSMTEQGFMEVETPILMKTSPEGARDFLVPSRVHPGKAYGLPQSPQLFKQTLMACGIDKYFQICKCFRDEDLRADRQLEFTQLDMEMSFVRQEDVFAVMERLMTTVWRELARGEVAAPFPRMTWDEAMTRFGSDKPETRFGMELFDFADRARGSGFRVFAQAMELPQGTVRGMVVKGGAALSRKQIDEAEAVAKSYGAGGMAWVKLTAEGPQGSIAKFLAADDLAALTAAGAAQGDLVVFTAGRFEPALNALGQVRLHFGRVQNLVDSKLAHFVWITDFPMFEWNEDEKRFEAKHHMFTAPSEPLPPLGGDLSHLKASLYDLVLNGNEIGSGSIRIHQPEVQAQVFAHVGLTPEQAQDKFGWFLRVLEYGAPPHGGIALGVDRIAMILAGAASLREVIAFPKNASGICPLTQSPSAPDTKQWDELQLRPVSGG
ncbi:MAG: aspartate--tRNA ligase [Planctomycetes bacterium]|nr:aspartate--tRNA ligase [Planctomycetota bacterium]